MTQLTTKDYLHVTGILLVLAAVFATIVAVIGYYYGLYAKVAVVGFVFVCMVAYELSDHLRQSSTS